MGDFVEYWLGDDDCESGLEPTFNALARFSENTSTYFMHGNRDFLIGQSFADRYNLHLLSDATVIHLYDTPTLLMHGDTLCTDDHAYQKFRQEVRDPAWQKEFLAKPLIERRTIVNELRNKSQAAMQDKTPEIMDVNLATVERTLIEHNVVQLIHGHTHRPNVHSMDIDGKPYKRYVLGDWYKDISFISATKNKITLHDYRYEQE